MLLSLVVLKQPAQPFLSTSTSSGQALGQLTILMDSVMYRT